MMLVRRTYYIAAKLAIQGNDIQGIANYMTVSCKTARGYTSRIANMLKLPNASYEILQAALSVRGINDLAPTKELHQHVMTETLVIAVAAVWIKKGTAILRSRSRYNELTADFFKNTDDPRAGGLSDGRPVSIRVLN